jgi:hypothetical protein
MNVIYLVQRCGGDYECSWDIPIKAFFDQTAAELFALECNEASAAFMDARKKNWQADPKLANHPDPDFDSGFAGDQYEIMEVSVE